MVLCYIVHKAFVTAKMPEEELVPLVQRDSGARDAKVERVKTCMMRVIPTKTAVGDVSSPSLRTDDISAPSATWIVDNKPGTSTSGI